MKLFAKKKTLTMSEKVAQIINDHDTELEKLGQESDDALETFKSTVTKLQGINDKIDESVTLMDQQIANLTQIKTGMLEKKNRNERVKGKIQEFLA